MAEAAGSGEADGPRICEPGGSGLLLPVGGETELNLDPRLKVMLYGMGLVYSFLGVSIVADMFMSAIERITSAQKKVPVPGTTRFATEQVWNETVANLTLMALGSSAPEIMLALNDVLKNRFFEGSLGPSTIVGSAAFNLFCIIAVCINSIPEGEVRRIKEQHVFVVTAIWSIFAYLWLLYIVQFQSQNVVEVWEGVLTFFFFPILVVHAWATDQGMLTRENAKAFFWDIIGKCRVEVDEDATLPMSIFLGACGVLALLCRGVCWLLLKILSIPAGMVSCLYSGVRKRKAMCSRQFQVPDEEEAEEVLSHAQTTCDLPEVIVDDAGEEINAECGIMSFLCDEKVVRVGTEETSFKITVYRRNGDRGRVSVAYRMVPWTAVPGYDFVEDEGELVFRDSVMEQELEVTILPKRPGECNDKFQLVIEDETETVIFNPYHDGGEERNILTVYLLNENPRAQTFGHRVYSIFDYLFNADEVALGCVHWKEQVVEAIYCNGSPEEQSQASIVAWLVHLIWLPWKVPFAVFIPPPTFWGGKVCFASSLLGIAFLTIIIGDLAELFGCALGINDAITAISIVAMGTSVPDLFASRTAAKQDEYADASIVNVTGSNSVNVFLGIGLPWMVAAVYWSFGGANAEWVSRYGETYGSTWGANGGAAFIVQSGQLFFSVCVFTLAACVCLLVLVVRRTSFGGELGGPPDPKAYSSFLLLLLWFSYIGLSTWQLTTNTESFVTQLGVVGIAIPIDIGLLALFALLVKTLKFSKKYIGEEGFWGVFVAFLVIAGRMLVYFVFQYSG